jgi:hypothetical protein
MAHTSTLWRKKPTVFMIRDPRDVVVSFYFHVKYRGPKALTNYKMMSMSEFVRHPVFGVQGIIDFYKFWFKRLKKVKSHLLVFEELIWDDVYEFARMLDFIGINIDTGRMIESVKQCRFDNLKRDSLKENGIFKNHPERWRYDSHKDINDKSKFRRGKAGGYTDYLTADDIVFCSKYLKKIPKPWRLYK